MSTSPAGRTGASTSNCQPRSIAERSRKRTSSSPRYVLVSSGPTGGARSRSAAVIPERSPRRWPSRLPRVVSGANARLNSPWRAPLSRSRPPQDGQPATTTRTARRWSRYWRGRWLRMGRAEISSASFKNHPPCRARPAPSFLLTKSMASTATQRALSVHAPLTERRPHSGVTPEHRPTRVRISLLSATDAAAWHRWEALTVAISGIAVLGMESPAGRSPSTRPRLISRMRRSGGQDGRSPGRPIRFGGHDPGWQ